MEHGIEEIHIPYQCYFQGCLSCIVLIPSVFELIKVAICIVF